MPPRIATPRLVLTWPSDAQLTGYHQAIIGTDIFDTLLWDGPEHDRSLHEHWALRRASDPDDLSEPFSLSILERSSDACIGGISLRPVDRDPRILHIGYAIAPAWHRRGLGTEAITAMVDEGFRARGAERIFATIFVGNVASRRAAEKAGLRFEGTLRRAVLKRGVWRDEWLLAITRPDWEASQSS